MACFYEDDNPWLIVRADADVLEDEYDRLLDVAEVLGVDEALLVEQEAIEKGARRKAKPLDAFPECDEDEDGVWDAESLESLEEPEPLTAILRDAAADTPLYRESTAWAKDICALFRSSADREAGLRLLRAALHAVVVPVKIRFADDEADFDDSFASEIAGVEYALARAYLKAALRSLREAAAFCGEASLLYARGCLLKERLVKIERKVEERRQSFRFRPL